ncbi:MAG: right-handed parallel beta-helix repeat-containing protein [Promethearchaeota archaeon]
MGVILVPMIGNGNRTFTGINEGSCLIIKNSKAQLIIKNCEFTRSQSEYDRAGLKNINASNINIQNCKFKENYNSIIIQESNDIAILNCKINNNEDEGLDIKNSKNLIISNNDLKANNDGICIDDSNSIIVVNNSIKDNYSGINAYRSRNCSIMDNKINYNYNGISFYNIKQSEMGNNIINWNEKNGIFLNSSLYNLICSNEICENKIGIQILKSSCNNEVKFNSLYGNEYYIVEEETCEDNFIQGNDPNNIIENIGTIYRLNHKKYHSYIRK